MKILPKETEIVGRMIQVNGSMAKYHSWRTISHIIPISSMTYKNVIFISLILFAFSAQAQTRFGFKAGVNSANADFRGHKSSHIVRFYAGAVVEMPLMKKVTLRPELLFSEKGFMDFPDSIAITLTYLNLPVLVGYEVVDNLNLYLGPEFGYNIAERKNPGGRIPVDVYNNFDMGLVIGASYSPIKRLGIEVRYVRGMAKIMSISNSEGIGTNRVLQLGLVFYLKRE
jgi:hypothetical protein